VPRGCRGSQCAILVLGLHFTEHERGLLLLGHSQIPWVQSSLHSILYNRFHLLSQSGLWIQDSSHTWHTGNSFCARAGRETEFSLRGRFLAVQFRRCSKRLMKIKPARAPDCCASAPTKSLELDLPIPTFLATCKRAKFKPRSQKTWAGSPTTQGLFPQEWSQTLPQAQRAPLMAENSCSSKRWSGSVTFSNAHNEWALGVLTLVSHYLE